MRVQIPAYTDRWMMGDRYGEIVHVQYWKRNKLTQRNDNLKHPVARVKLDKSGKVVRVNLDDCTEV